MSGKKEMTKENITNTVKIEPVMQETPVWIPTNKLPVTLNPQVSTYVDPEVVKSKYYNSFNYSKLPAEYKHLHLTLGLTSAKEGEGKSLVATNFAVSFAMGYRRRTILVDMNFRNPAVHRTFGVEAAPGIADAIKTGNIRVTKTVYDQLDILPVGDIRDFRAGLGDIMAIRNIIHTLEQEYEFVIVDMNSIFPIEEFPVLFANEMNGLMLVVDTQKTRYADLDRVFQNINKEQVVGFIFNRVNEHR